MADKTNLPQFKYNPNVIDELAHRTPNFNSWQDQEWKDCCSDFCAYLGPVGTRELEELGIAAFCGSHVH